MTGQQQQQRRRGRDRQGRTVAAAVAALCLSLPLAAQAEDPLINVYMRGSADRVPAQFPMVLHFVPNIPAWSTGELMSAVLSDAGLQELRRQCGKHVGLTEEDHIPFTTTYSGVARIKAGCLKGFLEYNAKNKKSDVLPYLDAKRFTALDSGLNVTFEVKTDRGIDGSWWLVPWNGNGPVTLKQLQQCYPPGYRWCTEPKDVRLAPSGKTPADVEEWQPRPVPATPAAGAAAGAAAPPATPAAAGAAAPPAAAPAPPAPAAPAAQGKEGEPAAVVP